MASKEINHGKPPKDFDTGVHKFHQSLGAIKNAADRAKDSPQLELPADSVVLSPSVAIRHDL
jgi:hypothetical protein